MDHNIHWQIDGPGMLKTWGLLITAFLLIPSSGAWAEGEEPAGWLMKDVLADHRNFYSGVNLGKLAIGLGVAGILANTSADGRIQDWYRESLRSEATEDLSGMIKPLGNGRIALPVYLGVFILGELTDHTSVGATAGLWAGRSLRTFLVGAPPVLFLQRALGGSRPVEDDFHWRPFEDDNGVSGHSFVGAIPFLSAAKMADNRYLKFLWYSASTLCGLSRINDDAHYFSQSALGWWMAYLASSSVDRAEVAGRKAGVRPVPLSDGVAVAVVLRLP